MDTIAAINAVIATFEKEFEDRGLTMGDDRIAFRLNGRHYEIDLR